MPKRRKPEAAGGGVQDGPTPRLMVAQRLRRKEQELASALQENARIRRAMHAMELRFLRLVDQALIGICLHDGRRFTYANRKFTEITGYSVDELLHMGPLDLIAPDARAMGEDLIRRGFAGEFDKNFTTTMHVLRKDGTLMIAELTGGPPVEIDGHQELVAMLADITDRVRAENEVRRLHRQLVEQATRDALTGLFNRRYMEETLARELTRAEREGQQVSLVMGDVDGFKSVNDRYGHRFGDDALQLFGGLILQYSRRSDVPCRFGGDEVLLILPGMGQQHACERAELLRQKMAEVPIRIGDVSVSISASFGVATYPGHACDADGLIAAADRALYRAKALGRNRVVGLAAADR